MPKETKETKETSVISESKRNLWGVLLVRLSSLRLRVAWYVMRIYGIECTFQEVQKGCYSCRQDEDSPIPDEIPSPDDVLELSRDIYKEENKRQSSVNEKCKVLLTISTILLALISLLLIKVSFSFWGLFLVLFVFLAVFMLLVYFDIGCYSRPNINKEMSTLEKDKFKLKLAGDYLSCANHNRQVHDFLVDVYRVAKNSLLLGLACLVILVFTCYIEHLVRHSISTVDTLQSKTANINPEHYSDLTVAEEFTDANYSEP